MQPTELQVQRSLEALRTANAAGADGDGGPAEVEGPAEVMIDVPTEVLRHLESQPAVRPDRLAEARERLAAGDQPTAEALAQRMVGRLVCDRLR